MHDMVKREECMVPEGSILIRFGNREACYVQSAYLKEDDNMEELGMRVHLGTVKDTLVIDNETLTIRFGCYLLQGKLQFYRWRNDGKAVYLENAGDEKLNIETPYGEILLAVGERVRIDESLYK